MVSRFSLNRKVIRLGACSARPRVPQTPLGACELAHLYTAVGLHLPPMTSRKRGRMESQPHVPYSDDIASHHVRRVVLNRRAAPSGRSCRLLVSFKARINARQNRPRAYRRLAFLRDYDFRRQLHKVRWIQQRSTNLMHRPCRLRRSITVVALGISRRLT